MFNLLKLLGKGLLYFILIPVGICFFAFYGVYLLVVWFWMLFRSIILFFKGKPTGLTLQEDIKAKEILSRARDFSEPEPPKQPQVATFNLNINGQHIGQTTGNLENQHGDYIDYSTLNLEHKNDEDKK